MTRHRDAPDTLSTRSQSTADAGAATADPGASVAVTTADGVLLHGIHLPGAHLRGGRRPRDTDLAFVVAHGLTNDTGKASSRIVLDAFAEHGTVVAFDFRGHGGSGGRSTVGRDEVLDLDAAIGFARALGHRRVAVIGFSMGGAVALRHAGLVGQGAPELTESPDVVVSVSAPSRWFLRDSDSMRRVQWLLEHPLGALVAPRLGIRLGQPWSEIPTTPLEMVAQIAPTPLLIVHGTVDHYFDQQQAQDLHLAAPGSELWLIDDMAHAESGISRATVDRIASWASASMPNRQTEHPLPGTLEP